MPENQLIHELSPYLLQHAYNPVNWYAWNAKTFETARSRNKPILLSIGYSTCHWCHVMAHESFEDEETAAILNETFINIKVDREERPDIDKLYMSVIQLMNGSGGWPLTILITPDKKPFFAATYIPRESINGKLGLKKLARQVGELWNSDNLRIQRTATEITEALTQYQGIVKPDAINPILFERAFTTFEQSYDKTNGGFGKGSKFPTPQNMMFLLRHHHLCGSAMALEMATHTLEQICLGGIHDHIGGGFHRYTTDAAWHTPHFEKMAYDQAMVIIALTEAWQVTGNDLFRQSVNTTVTFLTNELYSPEGMFYSALDADSEGIEGRFYTWSWEKLSAVLNNVELETAALYWGIKPEGNFNDESTGQPTGLNILHAESVTGEFAKSNNVDHKILLSRLSTIREKLAKTRKQRPRPFLDDKVLTDWNGLMITALARAGAAFHEKEYLETAIRAASAILDHLVDKKGNLQHSFRAEKAGTFASVDDYASFCMALLELHQVTGDITWLETALLFYNRMKERFIDRKSGSFFLTSSESEETIIRQKDFYDGAIPSGNSMAALCSLWMSRITANPDFEHDYEMISEAFGGYVNQYPTAYTFFLTAHQHATGRSREIVIVEEKKDSTYNLLVQKKFSAFYPFTLLLYKNNSNSDQLTRLAPFTIHYKAEERKATGYLCINKSCHPVASGAEKIIGLLGIDN